MTDTLTGTLTFTFDSQVKYDLALVNINMQSIYTNVQADPSTLTITVTLNVD
jgi:hypothetical protein